MFALFKIILLFCYMLVKVQEILFKDHTKRCDDINLLKGILWIIDINTTGKVHPKIHKNKGNNLFLSKPPIA